MRSQLEYRLFFFYSFTRYNENWCQFSFESTLRILGLVMTVCFKSLRLSLLFLLMYAFFWWIIIVLCFSKIYTLSKFIILSWVFLQICANNLKNKKKKHIIWILEINRGKIIANYYQLVFSFFFSILFYEKY